ncbi:hypothetical protein [Tannerella sp.]|uniref:hypothetical protein n=1 Tax=Tannerella sp. TaxID=2382127 RepID=UPI0026DCA52E|nr:hypothetical protein [Tannerella sp.]MDO4702829.1 hypothetical protein [Tannerella sp.]
MHSSISSKLSLYDILAMLIPGALIIFWASNVIFGNNLTIDESRINPWIIGVFFTATSYLVGIIYCKFMEWLWEYIWKPFKDKSNVIKAFCRNDPDIIIEELEKVFDSIPIEKFKIYYEEYLLSNCQDRFFLKKIRYLDKKKKQAEEKNKEKNIKDAYYEAYAFVAKNTYRNDVHILESQFAFLKSMFGVALLYEVTCLLSFLLDLSSHVLQEVLCKDYTPKLNFKILVNCLLDSPSMCWISISLLILLIAIPFVMACIQKKIYEIVWEDYKYLHRVKDDK